MSVHTYKVCLMNHFFFAIGFNLAWCVMKWNQLRFYFKLTDYCSLDWKSCCVIHSSALLLWLYIYGTITSNNIETLTLSFTIMSGQKSLSGRRLFTVFIIHQKLHGNFTGSFISWLRIYNKASFSLASCNNNIHHHYSCIYFTICDCCSKNLQY